jgi:hypothetical protein
MLIMKEVVKTPFLRRLFPKIISSEELETRRRANRETVVEIVGGIGRYITQEDMDNARKRLNLPNSKK